MATNFRIDLKSLFKTDVALLRSLGDLIRDAVFGKLSNSQKVLIDFSGIRSISRAFAHELLVLKEDPSLKEGRIEFTNATPDISKLLEAVSESRFNAQKHFRPDLLPKEVSFEEISDHFDDRFEAHIN